MKTWEQAEFEAQQEAIQMWAAKKYDKILVSRRTQRLLRKLRKLAKIMYNDNSAFVYINIEVEDKWEGVC